MLQGQKLYVECNIADNTRQAYIPGRLIALLEHAKAKLQQAISGVCTGFLYNALYISLAR